MKKIILIVTVFFVALSLKAQEYKRLIAEGTHTVELISEAAERHFDSVGRGKGTGYKQFKRWEYQAQKNMNEEGLLKSSEFYFNELERYNAFVNENMSARTTTVGSWEDMGPTSWNQTTGWNPGVGRITSIAIEEANTNHIIVGAETGGVWKSLNGGQSWTVLTDNLSNLDVYALTIHPNNANIYYWGTSSGVILKSQDAGATWNILGDIGNGRVNKILIDPSNPAKMYCSAEYGGGVFKSTDSGATWNSISSEMTTGYDVEFKPGDYNTIYASGNKFYKSTDGGVTFNTPEVNLLPWTQEYVIGALDWTIASSNQNGSVVPKTGNAMAFLYVANTSNTKTRLITPELNLSGAVNPQLNFSYTLPNWGNDQDELKVFYKTSENGTWTQLAYFNSNITNWEDVSLSLPNTNATYYIAFEGNAKYGYGVTLDDISIEDSNLGVVFENGFEGLGSSSFSSGPKMMAVSAASTNILYVIEATNTGSFNALYKSTNSGNTFTRLNHADKNYFGYSSNPQDPDDATRGQAPRDMDIVVNPNNSDDVYIAGVNTWKSIDGGVNFSISSQWRPSVAQYNNIGYCHADVDILLYLDNKLYVGSDGGIFVANNPQTVNSNYYTDLSSGLSIHQFYNFGISQTTPVVVTGGTQDNGSSVLGSDGLWSSWLGADGMEGFVDKNNSNIIYGTIYNGELYKSINGGLSLTNIVSPQYDGNWVTPFEQDPIAQNVIYVGYDKIYKSTNGGNIWGTISQDFGSNLDHLKIAKSNNNIMYASSGYTLYKTEDGGATNWITLSGFSGSINSIAIHPTDPNRIAIATTANAKVYVSTNGGVAWTPYTYDLPDFSARALVWDNTDNRLYLGMNYGVYYIDDNSGNSWQPFSNGLPNVYISELEINEAEGKLYAATYGRGLWRTNINATPSLSVNELGFDDLEIYPNPAKTKISLKWDNQENVSIRVYNTLGKLMFYNKKINLFNGLDIDVSSYNSGMYYIRLSSPKGELTKKLIIE